MVEFKNLFSLGKETSESFVKSIKSQELNSLKKIEKFDGLPTSVIFEPVNGNFDGSFHYMRFPYRKSQRWHYHFKQRYLLILGTCDLEFSFSNLNIDNDPNKSFNKVILEKYILHCVRFSEKVWHKFSTKNSEQGDLIAFSFHENDDGEIFNDGFMEELTVFFDEE